MTLVKVADERRAERQEQGGREIARRDREVGRQGPVGKEGGEKLT